MGSVERMANDAVLFGKAEIPMYLRELIRWEMLSSLATGGALFVAAIPCVMAARWGARKVANDKSSYGPDPGAYIATGLGALAAIILLANCTIQALNAGRAYFAPRVLLVEKLSSMVRK